MAAMLPGHAVDGALPRRVVLMKPDSHSASSVTLTFRQRRAVRPLGTFTLDEAGMQAMRLAMRAAGRTPLALCLPPGALLEREVVLPLAVEREAGNALRYEIDRFTPFRADEIFWSWEVTRRDRGRGRLHLRLFLVPRAAVERALTAPSAAGASATWLEGRTAEGTWRAIAVRTTAWHPWQRHTLRAAGLACAALAAAAVATPFVRQSLAGTEVEVRIAGLVPRAREVEALQRRIAQDAASGDAMTTTQAEFGDALGVLAALTAILPDDTFLIDLSMKQRRLTLHGQSTNATKLIAVLSADRTIRNPSFAAAVTRTPGGGADLFTIAAEAVP